MRRGDEIPELMVIDEHGKRDTIELCGDEQQGLRCMLTKGHDGMHECLANPQPMRWMSSTVTSR